MDLLTPARRSRHLSLRRPVPPAGARSETRPSDPEHGSSGGCRRCDTASLLSCLLLILRSVSCVSLCPSPGPMWGGTAVSFPARRPHLCLTRDRTPGSDSSAFTHIVRTAGPFRSMAPRPPQARFARADVLAFPGRLCTQTPVPADSQGQRRSSRRVFSFWYSVLCQRTESRLPTCPQADKCLLTGVAAEPSVRTRRPALRDHAESACQGRASSSGARGLAGVQDGGSRCPGPFPRGLGEGDPTVSTSSWPRPACPGVPALMPEGPEA